MEESASSYVVHNEISSHLRSLKEYTTSHINELKNFNTLAESFLGLLQNLKCWWKQSSTKPTEKCDTPCVYSFKKTVRGGSELFQTLMSYFSREESTQGNSKLIVAREERRKKLNY